MSREGGLGTALRAHPCCDAGRGLPRGSGCHSACGHRDVCPGPLMPLGPWLCAHVCVAPGRTGDFSWGVSREAGMRVFLCPRRSVAAADSSVHTAEAWTAGAGSSRGSSRPAAGGGCSPGDPSPCLTPPLKATPGASLPSHPSQASPSGIRVCPGVAAAECGLLLPHPGAPGRAPLVVRACACPTFATDCVPSGQRANPPLHTSPPPLSRAWAPSTATPSPLPVGTPGLLPAWPWETRSASAFTPSRLRSPQHQRPESLHYFLVNRAFPSRNHQHRFVAPHLALIGPGLLGRMLEP